MKVIDLSLPLSPDTQVFPGDPKPVFEQSAVLDKDGWNQKIMTFSTHFGTHVDAPIHMVERGKSLSDFPLETFFGEGTVLTLNDDLESVKQGDIVFFYTGQTEKIGSDEFFQNNPAVPLETAKRLVNIKVKLVGVDSFTIDNEPYDTHKTLLGNDILIVENLVNLKELIGKRFQCYALPLNIDRGDGSPCRALAILP